ncbi:citrate synthase [Microscilla marina]|uniref:Citrate synthase n=1 Tax=Microscilla marina ATCC 23134 TaxID=313606 RepID=A1ZFX8_MICM2|nr:citrate synthase [Microscilla marina]EAY30902.1 citrate synthase I [Microscilla marina ATCC 23134]
MSNFAELTIDGKTYKLPVYEGSEGEKSVDITKLRAQTGLVTLDSGFKNTGATTSGITFLNGEAGVLRYRGYAIEDLAEHASFLEVAYLLIYGNLPNPEELNHFTSEITRRTLVNEGVKKIFAGFPVNAHPMGVMASLASSLASFYPESIDPHRTPDLVNLTIIRLLAKFPTLAAWSYKNSNGHPVNYPRNKLNYVQNFMQMMFALPTYEYEIDPDVEEALNKLLILHADHEQNCSTSAVRLVGSSQASLYSSVSAGISALWGPLHGGANQQVIEMLDKIHQDGGDVKKYIEKAKDKNDTFRLMGFGHRVYKNFDPRARIIKKSCDKVLNKLGIKDPTLEIAKKLEETALNDDYFVERKLYPNVDFYSGIIYRALGFPIDMFTVMFTLGRLPGWIAQWKEMREAQQPISRPRQIYTGSTARDFVKLEDRGSATDLINIARIKRRK